MSAKRAKNQSNAAQSDLSASTSFLVENVDELQRMVTALDYADGFAIFFARCNLPIQRQQLIEIATRQLADAQIRALSLTFDSPIRDLREHLRRLLTGANIERASRKLVLFISGLEYSIPFEIPNPPVLTELNLGRELFQRDIPYSLVFWLPDYAITAVARYAPDFWAWRSSVFEFTSLPNQRSAAIQKHVWHDAARNPIINLTIEEKERRRRLLESLLDEYKDLPNDKRLENERADLLVNLGIINNALFEREQALINYQRAYALYQATENLIGAINTLLNIGTTYDELGDKRQALQYYEQALAIERKVKDSKLQSSIISRIGSVYDDLGDKQTALENYAKALELDRKTKDSAGERHILNQMGLVFSDLGNHRRAITYFEQALQMNRKFDDTHAQAMALNNIGLATYRMGNPSKSLDYYNQALPLVQKLGNGSSIGLILGNVGQAYDKMGDKQKALEFYEQALSFNLKTGNRWMESYNRFNMAMVYVGQGDLTRAENELHRVIAIDESTGHPDLERDKQALENVIRLRKMQEKLPSLR